MIDGDIDKELVSIAQDEIGRNVFAGGDYVLIAMRRAYELGKKTGDFEGYKRGWTQGHAEGHWEGVHSGEEKGYEKAVKFLRESA